MRPKSIVIFDWLFLASLILSMINSALTYSAMTAQFRTDPALAPVASAGGPFLIVSIAVGLGISLLLWFLISRRASNGAKWILVAFTAFGVLSVVRNLQEPIFGSGVTAAMVGLSVLQVATVFFLFRPDAAAWLEGKAPVDPDVFK